MSVTQQGVPARVCAGVDWAKDDHAIAVIDPDVVRTDRRRLRPLVRDSAATTALRTTVRARRDLVEHRVAAANQLRAHLQIVFPGATSLFAAIDSAISLTFLWIHIIWRAWQDNVGYDPIKHGALQALLNSKTEKAA